MVENEDVYLTAMESMALRIRRQDEVLEDVLEALSCLLSGLDVEAAPIPYLVQDLVDSVRLSYEEHLDVTPLLTGPINAR